ncbi:MAG: MFS transporter [Elusimicrobiota bacterium]|jgi:MFS family permease|nr:MFS transporter [Elusimicrobiota bacterium]
MSTNNQAVSNAVSNAMYLLMFSFSISVMSLQILMTNIVDTFSLKGSMQAMMPAMSLLGGAAAVVLLPFIKGRIPKPSMLLISAIVMGAALAGLGFLKEVVIAILACFILGIFTGWIDTYTNSTIVDLHKKNSQKYVGYLQASFCIGAVGLPFFIHFLMTNILLTWVGVCVVLGIIILITAAIFFFVARKHKETMKAESQEQKLTLIEVKTFAKDKFYLLMVVCYGCYCLSQNGISIWLFRYTQLTYPIYELLPTLSVSLFWVGNFISRMFPSIFNTHQMKLFVYCMIISVVTHLIGIFSGNAAVFVIMTFIMSLASGLGFPVLINETLIHYHGNTSMALSGIYFSGKLGAFIIPLAMGAVAVSSLNIAMALNDIMAAVSIVCAIIVIGLDKKPRPPVAQNA